MARCPSTSPARLWDKARPTFKSSSTVSVSRCADVRSCCGKRKRAPNRHGFGIVGKALPCSPGPYCAIELEELYAFHAVNEFGPGADSTGCRRIPSEPVCNWCVCSIQHIRRHFGQRAGCFRRSCAGRTSDSHEPGQEYPKRCNDGSCGQFPDLIAATWKVQGNGSCKRIQHSEREHYGDGRRGDASYDETRRR